MKLNYIKDNRQQWISWKQEQDCTPEEKRIANLRGMYNDEIVLDCESKVHSKEVVTLLNKTEITYEMWDTGSRGVHFHFRVEGLDQLNEEERKKYRELVIVRYQCDIAKKSGIIARENKPHFKTGKNKKLIKKHPKGKNKLDMGLLQKIKGVEWFTVQVSSTTADDLKNRLPISKVIRDLGGKCYSSGLANCCLHLPDKNPSMSYDDSKGLYYCFHTGTGGDVFTLLQEKKGISFIEAKRIIAEMAGLPDIELISNDHGTLDFDLRSVSTILDGDMPNPQFRVEGLIPESGVTYIAAPPGVGKSMLMLFLSCCICTGTPFMGRKVIQGKVLYFDAENGEICAYNRLKRISEAHSMSNTDLAGFYYSIFPHLRFDNNHQSYNSMIQLTREFKPSVIIFDSLVRFMDGSENDAESCKKVFDYLRILLKDNPHLTIIILHHVSKMNGGGMNAMRGSSELAASASTILMLHRKKKGIHVTVEKSRYLDLNQDNGLFYKIYNENGLYFSKEDVEDAPVDAIGNAYESWQEWVVKRKIEQFTTKLLMDNLIKQGHSKDSLYKLIHYLQETGVIMKIKHGAYKLVAPIVTVEE